MLSKVRVVSHSRFLRPRRVMTLTYNRDAAFQAAVFQSAAPVLTSAMNRLCSGLSDEASLLSIADFGTSGGANSLHLLKFCVNFLRDQLSTGENQREIVVYLNDLPDNDWLGLIKTIDSPASILKTTLVNPVHSYLVPRSFYEPLFPSKSLDLVVSMISLHWISRSPQCLYPHLSHLEAGVTPQLKELWAQQAHGDLTKFLRHRANELKPGGQLVVSMVAKGEGGGGVSESPPIGEWAAPALDLHTLVDLRCLESMGLLTHKEAARISIPVYFRSEQEVLAAAAEADPSLEVRELTTKREVYSFPSPFHLADFYLSIMLPSLLACLDDPKTRNDHEPAVMESSIGARASADDNTQGSAHAPEGLFTLPRRERAIHQALRSSMAAKIRAPHQLKWKIDYLILSMAKKGTTSKRLEEGHHGVGL